MDVWIVFMGEFGTARGAIEGVFSSRESAVAYIEKVYPDYEMTYPDYWRSKAEAQPGCLGWVELRFYIVED